MRVLLSIVVGSILVGTAGSASAASFDCKKARTKAEKLICATPALSKADEELGRQYKAARAATKDAKGLRETQQRWVRKHRDTCADAACMLEAYEHRIPEFGPRSSLAVGRGSIPFTTTISRSSRSPRACCASISWPCFLTGRK